MCLYLVCNTLFCENKYLKKWEAGSITLGWKQHKLDFQHLHDKESMSTLYFIVQRQMEASFTRGLISVLKNHINFCKGKGLKTAEFMYTQTQFSLSTVCGILYLSLRMYSAVQNFYLVETCIAWIILPSCSFKAITFLSEQVICSYSISALW